MTNEQLPRAGRKKKKKKNSSEWYYIAARTPLQSGKFACAGSLQVRQLPFWNHEFLDTKRIVARDAMKESGFRWISVWSEVSYMDMGLLLAGWRTGSTYGGRMKSGLCLGRMHAERAVRAFGQVIGWDLEIGDYETLNVPA